MNSRMSLTRWFSYVLFGGLGIVLVVLAVLATRPVAAQGDGLRLEKSLLKDSPVVKVGETLTFAITITNNWNTTVITLPLIDEYDASVLGYLDATPAPDTTIAASGVISWNNILESTGPLSPGDQIVVYVRFVAEHPSPRVVNKAYTHDAYDYLGNAVNDGEAEDDSIFEGGRTPLTKTLALGTAAVGEVITFNIAISNDGAARILQMPVRDRFDPTVLQFHSAEPPIDAEEAGTLVWSNVLRPPLPTVLEPQQTVVLTVAFRVIGDPQLTNNEAEVLGATDGFGNNLAPAADDVPIQIVPGDATPTTVPQQPTSVATPVAPTNIVPAPATPIPGPAASATPATTAQPGDSTPVPTDESNSEDDSDEADDAADAVTPTAPLAGGPGSLPDTGAAPSPLPWLVALGVALISLWGLLQWSRKPDHQ